MDGPWRSVEHVLPESLGNTELILPRGVVCDGCNNGRLAPLDEALVQFEPIAMLRTVLFVPRKNGKLPTVRFSNAHLTAREDNTLLIDNQTNKRAMTGGPRKSQLDLVGRQVTPKRTRVLVRALYKAALELVWLDHRDRLAMAPLMDPVRRMVLGEEEFSGYLAMTKRGGEPRRESSFTYQFVDIDGSTTLALCAELFGLQLFTDTHHRTVRDPDAVREEFNLVEF